MAAPVDAADQVHENLEVRRLIGDLRFSVISRSKTGNLHCKFSKPSFTVTPSDRKWCTCACVDALSLHEAFEPILSDAYMVEDDSSPESKAH